jgi:hypothetical protein
MAEIWRQRTREQLVEEMMWKRHAWKDEIGVVRSVTMCRCRFGVVGRARVVPSRNGPSAAVELRRSPRFHICPAPPRAFQECTYRVKIRYLIDFVVDGEDKRLGTPSLHNAAGYHFLLYYLNSDRSQSRLRQRLAVIAMGTNIDQADDRELDPWRVLSTFKRRPCSGNAVGSLS